MERGKPLERRTPLKRGGPLRTGTPLRAVRQALRRTPLRAVSVKRAGQMNAYRPLRDAFLAAHPVCQYPPGCSALATDLHHKRGRFGERLLDKRHWATSCRFHNEWAETHTGEALAVGWLIPIEASEET